MLNNDFPFEWNVRRTSSRSYATTDLTNGGFRNAEGGQDSNIDLDDDNMDNLQKPNWWDDFEEPKRDGQEYDRARPGAERDWYQEDFERYHEEERDYQDFQWPDKYGWDQYA